MYEEVVKKAYWFTILEQGRNVFYHKRCISLRHPQYQINFLQYFPHLDQIFSGTFRMQKKLESIFWTSVKLQNELVPFKKLCL